MRQEVREEMRGGSGKVRITHIMDSEELTGHSRLVGRIVLDPGCSIGSHQHVQEEEIFYILSGWGEVMEDGVETEVGPGDAVLTGGGRSHSITSTGGEPLEFLAIILTY